jgi:hypothetical protein
LLLSDVRTVKRFASILLLLGYLALGSGLAGNTPAMAAGVATDV